MARILVTGASGFLGARISRDFVSNGHKVAIALRPTSDRSRVADLIDRVEVFNTERLDEAVNGFAPEVVINTATVYGRGKESVKDVVAANLTFPLTLLQACTGRPVTFINTGTSLAPTVSTYAKAKNDFVQWAAQIIAGGSLKFVNIKLEHMYGPDDDEKKFTSHVIRSCSRNVPTLPLTLGEQRRDFVYIDDVVAAYRLIVDRRDEMKDTFREVEVGSGKAVTVAEFVREAHRIAGSTTELQFGAVPYRAKEAMFCEADIATLVELGWTPRVALAEGIARIIQHENL